MNKEETFSCWIGSDEAGKGDYLGPLVVAAVCLKSRDGADAAEMGIRDSKKLSDAKVHEMSRKIKSHWPYAIVGIGPERYNELIKKMKNLNFLLAWAHGRAVEEVLKKSEDGPQAWVADQFGKAAYLEDVAQSRALKIKLIQRPRAEDDLAVAAASILARASFLTRLEALSKKFDAPLHKGAGSPTDEDARAFVAKHGAEKLGQVAKLHFKNTKRVLGS